MLISQPQLELHPNGGDLGEGSVLILQTCHPDLQTLVWYLTHYWDTTVISPSGGHRDQEMQEGLFQSGASKVQYPNSKHNAWPSEAVDISPWPINWSPSRANMRRWYWFNGAVIATWAMLRTMGKVTGRLRSGSDWDGDRDFSDQTFNDLPHFELRDPRPLTIAERQIFEDVRRGRLGFNRALAQV